MASAEMIKELRAGPGQVFGLQKALAETGIIWKRLWICFGRRAWPPPLKIRPDYR